MFAGYFYVSLQGFRLLAEVQGPACDRYGAVEGSEEWSGEYQEECEH